MKSLKSKADSAEAGKRIFSYISIVLAVVLIAVVCVCSVFKLRQDLYENRAYNAGRIMDKMAANIQTVLEGRVDDVLFYARLVSGERFADDAGAADRLAQIERAGDSGYVKDALLLIDGNGGCLSSGGAVLNWSDKAALSADGPQVLAGGAGAAALSGGQLLFVAPLPQSAAAAEKTFTHICLVMELGTMERFLAKASYLEKSAIFIIRGDGTFVYKQAEGSAFASAPNLIEELKGCEYRHKTSAAQTLDNIQSGTAGVACVEEGGAPHYVIYQPLGTNGWTAVYIVPEAGIADNSWNFMGSVILTISVFALIVMAIVSGFLAANYIRALKRRASEAERIANEAKNSFLSSMSHDVRTPMNAIVGMTMLAEKYIADTKYVKECLAKIKFSSDHLLALINDILDISKIESGKMTLTPLVFSLAEALQNMFNVVTLQSKAKNQTLNFRIEKIEHEYLCADELRLNQIFINLLTNAIKYTPEFGEITVTVREELCPEKENAAKLVYTVQDNGIGMSKEFMANMYVNFARAEDTRVNKIKGTGLGLSICKQLVDMMGGTIECESEPGKGTKFTVELTLDTAAPLISDYVLPKMKLLLVDDDAMFLEVAAETFKELESDIDTAESGEQALEMMSEQLKKGEPYKAVLLDWKMPGMDGLEVTREIHARFGEDVPVILVSAFDSTDVEHLAGESGAAGFMRKPFFKASLYQQLSHFLGFSKESSAEKSSPAQSDLDGMHILVAEDNDLNWEIAQELLDMSGIHSERAENGKICVERLLASYDGEFDLVLMDVQMPVMNGKDATREIRKAEQAYVRNIPIIAMTADAFAEDVSSCIEAGMNGHIPKPVEMEKLLFELRKIRYS